MSTFRRWAFWRRVQYGFGFLTFVSLGLSLVYLAFFYAPASCFDMVMNGRETGIDCGGKCIRICAASVTPPRIVWTQSFEITEGQYNAVAYIENSNRIASTPELHYTFELLDGDTVVATRSGTTILPPDSVYPIFEGRVFTEQSRKVTDTRLTLKAADLWIPASVGREQFKTSNVLLSGADGQPRLDVRIENSEVVEAKEVEVVATLFNGAGEPVTASQTYIDALDARSNKDIVFTWPNPIAKTVRSCIIPTDVAVTIDLSGSMNNDGNNPPQPITDALAAAKSFVEGLNKNDRSTIITFASNALIEVPLGADHLAAATRVGALTIDPVEEVGYTNTSAALFLAQGELNSERHNQDARRVVVILTDGLPTGRGDAEEIIAETKTTADILAADDISVYAIGLGKGVDLAFVNEIASDPVNAFYAPTTNDLAGIYQKITSSLCESGTARIDVIAKTKTNFVPLR
jgi:Mg-chelatase subunit ChlD